MMMNKILVVDDDPHIRELLDVILQEEGFAVYSAVDGREALSILEKHQVELSILDVQMPHVDGWELCTVLRKYYDFPLLMLTVNGEIHHKVKGLQLGADDYLVKPFDRNELVARIRALLRRYQIVLSQTVRLNELYMNQKTFEVNFRRERLTLPLKEFTLLFKLASYPGITFSRDQLIETVWGYDFAGNERTLDVHVNRLRERFADKNPTFQITTIRGLGYRLEVNS
jgi:DNA-binding response OmpR family regulator